MPATAAGSRQELRRLLASAEAVPVAQIGRVGGDRIRISIAGRTAIDEALRETEDIWSSAIGRYFEPKRAIA